MISTDLLEYQAAALTNKARAEAGLRPLIIDGGLTSLARLKSGDMRARGYCGHESPVYGSPFDMLNRYGINYHHAAENVAMGFETPEAVMNSWMESPAHKKNILNKRYERIGVGAAKDTNGALYWTQLFIG